MTVDVWMGGEPHRLTEGTGGDALSLELEPSCLRDPLNSEVLRGVRQLLRDGGIDVERMSDHEVLAWCKRQLERGELTLMPLSAERPDHPARDEVVDDDYALVTRAKADGYGDWKPAPANEVETWLRIALSDPSLELITRCETLLPVANVRATLQGDPMGAGLALLHRALVSEQTLVLLKRHRFDLGQAEETEERLAPGVDKTFIEIRLVDEGGAPVAGEGYAITLPDGTVRHGALDRDGFARVDRIDAGVCDITFPKLDGRRWGPR